MPENNQSSASAGGGRFQPGERVTSLGAAPDTPHIEFTDVIKRFGDNTVLNDLNFTVAQGERGFDWLRLGHPPSCAWDFLRS